MSSPVDARLPDAATREFAQREFHRPVAVEAGAGTGKTALLVARVGAWCLGPGWDRHAAHHGSAEDIARTVLDRVVAITFTEAAASEMASKVGRGFARLASGGTLEGWSPDPEEVPGDDELSRRATALADEIGRLRVHTIHAFCQRMLREAPLEAGVHPRFEVDGDGSRVEETVEEVVEELLRAGDAGRSADWRVLAAAGVGPATVAEATVGAIAAGLRADDLEPDPFTDERAVAWAERLRAAVTRVRSIEAGRVRGMSRVTNGVKAVEGVDGVAARLESTRPGGPDFATLSAICRDVDDTGWARLRDWAQGTLAKTEREALQADASDLVAAAGELTAVMEPLRALRVIELDGARRVIAGLLRAVRERLHRRGILAYQDLLTGAADLLDRAPGVRREVRAGIDQLMVDEFQDTDHVQCRLVELLALDEDDGPRPGLFVVGDPKQSIYGWRRADLAAYHDFMARLVERGGTCELLTANFRSHQPILDEVGRVVEPVMTFEHGLQPSYQPLLATGDRVASTGFASEPWSAVEHWVCWPRNPESGVPKRSKSGHRAEQELEAEAVAADIRRLHEQGRVAWGSIAILLRSTTQQAVLLEAMQRRQIPFEVAREREYYRQREVVEAAGLVRCILEPEDTLALLTLLRSDMVGVPDGALTALWDAGFAARMAALGGRDGEALDRALGSVATAAGAVTGEAPGVETLPRWHAVLATAVVAVHELRRIERETSPDRFVTRVRDLMQPELTASARYLGAVRRARIERFFIELEQAMNRYAASPAAVARFLRRAVDEARESHLPPEPESDTDAVRVMTIHQAKGLDFAHVYLVQTHRGAGGRGSRSLVEVFDGGREYALFGWPTPGVHEARDRAQRRGTAENVRLLYVALTRAKERLVISGAWSKPDAVPDPESAATLGELVAHRRDGELLVAQAADGVSRRWDPETPHVQWVLPAAWDTSMDAIPAQQGRRDDAPARGALAADVASLSCDRVAAAARSKLPIGGRMSDEAHRLLDTADLEAEDGGAEAVARSVAAAVGTAVHAVLEELELDRPLADQVRAAGASLASGTGEPAREEDCTTVTARLDRVLSDLADSGCLQTLQSIAPRVVARELPVLAAPGTSSEVVGFLAGAVDLVYRDVDGTLVVADYKTDAVGDPAVLEQRIELYRPQLEAYADALTAAFALEGRPRRELWFLAADRIVRVD